MGERLDAMSVQGYGMTEMSPISHMTIAGNVRHGSSGQAVPSTECRIVNPETLEDMPPGEEGELWVRGPQVMKGYLNTADATAQTLTPDGWLRTGDLAIIDADGFMFIRDRLKELIKFKGFQVAPAEVEAALIAHPGVVDAAVIGRPDEEAGEAPIAFVVRAPGSDVGEAELKAHCEGCLAHYKAPGRIQFRRGGAEIGLREDPAAGVARGALRLCRDRASGFRMMSWRARASCLGFRTRAAPFGTCRGRRPLSCRCKRQCEDRRQAT